jgi:hypothetical protein
MKATQWDALGYYQYLPAIFIYEDITRQDWLGPIDSTYHVVGTGGLYQVMGSGQRESRDEVPVRRGGDAASLLSHRPLVRRGARLSEGRLFPTIPMGHRIQSIGLLHPSPCSCSGSC